MGIDKGDIPDLAKVSKIYVVLYQEVALSVVGHLCVYSLLWRVSTPWDAMRSIYQLSCTQGS